MNLFAKHYMKNYDYILSVNKHSECYLTQKKPNALYNAQSKTLGIIFSKVTQRL